MIIAGIDPGTAKTGYGIIQIAGATCVLKQYGCIETAAGDSPQKRLHILEQKIAKVFRSHSPDIVAMESIFFFKNVKTAVRVSQAQGVILLTAAKHHIGVSEYTPLQVKIALTGYGRAEKSQVQKTVQQTLSLTTIPKPDDAADALAVALCHFWHQKFTDKLRGAKNT